ncbi:MAG: hypothetical protein AAFX06_10415 [Planctomycetota bacterium]
MFKQFLACCAIGLLTTFAGCRETESTDSLKPSEEADSNEPTPPAPIELAELPDPEGEDGKYSIAQVMELAHSSRLYRQLFRVPVDPEVAERLTILYSGLPSQSPPNGEADSWNERSQALLDSATKIIQGDADSIPAFKKAVNCNSCHNRHR